VCGLDSEWAIAPEKGLSNQFIYQNIKCCMTKCRRRFYFRKLFSRLCYLSLALIQSSLSLAQDGTAGINEANNKVRGYFDAGTNLMYAIGAIVGLVGAVKVYNKWNAGDHDTGKVAAAWFGSCVFLVVVATVIKSFFGL
jgi:hypothetical protein